VFFGYGYSCQVKWIDDNSLNIIVCKDYNRNVYSIKTMKEKCSDIIITYDKTVSDAFGDNEPWAPED